MKRLILGFLVAVLITAGCRESAQQVPLAKREELRSFLDPAFTAASIPKEREDDFYRVLAAFAVDRRSDEFVRSVVFKSASEADISFSTTPNLHGGRGDATAKKVDGRWIIIEKVYVV
jgi:hypothetical protein